MISIFNIVRISFFGLFLLVSIILSPFRSFSQEKKVAVSGFDGIIVAGYVDEGAFLNFAGPNIAFKSGSSKWMLGMFPSLRYKKDASLTTTNTALYPALGAGLTVVRKRLVLQIPLYYNAKTSSKDGTWVVGFGIGYRLTP